MPNRLLEQLRSEFVDVQDRIRSTTDAAVDEGRELTEAEEANLTEWTTELEQRRSRIEQLASVERAIGATADALAGAPNDTAERVERVRGTRPILRGYESIGDYARARADGAVPREVREDVDRVLFEHARAFVDVTTADVPGLLPPSWVSDFAMLLRTSRPFISAFDQRPLPDTGMTLNYPAVVTKPQVGKQAAEKTDVASRKTTVSNNVANVSTYGGGEDVSIQVIQRTDPAYLTLMLELYAEQMAMTMDTEAITIALAAIAAGNEIALSLAAPTAWLGKLADGAALVLSANAVPDTFVVGINLWKAFASAVDTAGHPLFPNTAPSNPAGRTSLADTNGDVRGITMVVDPNMPAAKGVLGWSRAFTSFVGPTQTLSSDNPSKLGRDYAVFSMAAFVVRRPDAMVEFTLGA